MAWQGMDSAPHGVPVLVSFDHDADPYQDPEHKGRLTDYAAHAEGGDFLAGAGVTIAIHQDGWHEDDGWESANGPYWMPAAWWAWLNGDATDYVVNPIAWMPLPAIAMARDSAETACPAPVPQDCQARAESIAQTGAR